MAAQIPQCSASDDPAAMYGALGEAGCLVVHGMCATDTIAAVRSDLSAHMAAAAATDDRPDDFYPGLTRRVVALMHRSPTMRQLMMHPVVTELGDRHLRRDGDKWQLNVSAALEVGPGARDQTLHREDDLFPFFAVPRPDLVLASMWAISDFTADNGGTQLVPGSHRWDAGRVAEPHEIVRAEMPAGSVLFWLGGTLHGAGANVTDADWRYGVVLTFSLGWLRQEENQHLSIPLADALDLPAAMRHGSVSTWTTATAASVSTTRAFCSGRIDRRDGRRRDRQRHGTDRGRLAHGHPRLSGQVVPGHCARPCRSNESWAGR